MDNFFVSIDLSSCTVEKTEGIKPFFQLFANKRIQMQCKEERYGRTLIAIGTFYGFNNREALVEFLFSFLEKGAFKNSQQFSQLKGEFSLIYINADDKTTALITDRSGYGKLYYFQDNQRLQVSSGLKEQAFHQSNPQLSSLGVHAIFTLNYNFDPYTILHNTYSTRIGESIEVDSNGNISSFDNHVQVVEHEFHSSLNDSIDKCDKALTQYFETRYQPGTKPIIFLSGGIDSLIMTYYAKKVMGDKLSTLNFAIKNAPVHEMSEAREAADYYKTDHIQFLGDTTNLSEITLRTFDKTDYPQLGNFLNMLCKEWLLKEAGDQFLDVYTGEDSRIYSPTIDLPFSVGLYLTKKGVAAKRVKGLYNTIEKNWPIRYGRNYSKFFLNKATPSKDVQMHILKNMLRLNNEHIAGNEYMDVLLEETSSLKTVSRLEDIHYHAVDVSLRIQHSDDIHESVKHDQLGRLKTNLPFFDPDILSTIKNIPYNLIAKTKFISPYKTRSRYWLMDKYFLRKLMEGGKAPASLLYRSKATAGNPLMILDICWESVYKPLLLHVDQMLKDNVFPADVVPLIERLTKGGLADKTFATSTFNNTWQTHSLCWIGYFHKHFIQSRRVNVQ